VTRNWRQPRAFSEGDTAHVEVTQVPGGDVTGVDLVSCSGSEAFCESVVSAVHRASPLPEAPDPEVFDREIRFNFEPEGS
ncbi:MAG: energy transducer TonB, partial [Halofilum sp. (in: g-proteobacteria)]